LSEILIYSLGGKMRKFTKFLIVGLTLLLAQAAIYAQSTGAIGGTVVDPNGAVVPGATVKIKGDAGQEFSAVTTDNGTYRVPAISSGLYVVTITAPGFKTSTVKNVKVDVGTPLTVDVALEVGNVGENVEISSGGEVLQTQTATVGSTIQGRQITGTPIASRDALDLVGMLPGTATVGRPRTASINGLPKGALSITIDGVDVQVNDSRSSDGYFTYVRPRVDAIEEVTVSTANPGAESSGDGAIQIKMVTKRGSNDYRLGAFWQHRNDAFNANYWYLNRNPVSLDEDGRSVRQKMRLNQYGVNGSGPIPFLKFGEGTDGWLDSGKNKRFFFVNYEEFRQPQSLSRTRSVLTPDAQAGIYKYFAAIPAAGLPTGCVAAPQQGTGQMECSRNVFTIAGAAGQLATPDPTVAGLYNRIRTSLQGQTFTPITGNSNLVRWNTLATNSEKRWFLAMRFDVNITKNHAFEAVINRQNFGGLKDLLNGVEETFPGFPFYSQVSQRDSYAYAVRSTLSQNIVNEARYTIQVGGPTTFRGEASAAAFNEFMGGRSLGVSVLGATAPSIQNSTTREKSPVNDFTDSVTWVRGNHSFNFGGNYKVIKVDVNNSNRYVPSVGFGLDSTDPAFGIFNATAMPGATAGQLTDARNLYAVMVGRVLSFTTTAYLNTETGQYIENGSSVRKAEQHTYGLFAQDAWRIKPNFTVNYGVRWQPQTGFIAKSFGNYTRLESYDQVYGISGLGNIFKPGATGGTAPRVVALEIGEKSYPDDLNNFGPTVGVVWSPNFGDSGFMRTLFGKSGQSVFRGGYSVSFVREGTDLLQSINGANPGGTRSMSRATNITGVNASGQTVPSLTIGTNLRDANNPNLTAFQPTPIAGTQVTFPIALGSADVTNAFNPNIKTGQVRSYSFGYQRELDRNTVVELRYVGNQGVDLQRQYNLNEFNTVENGFASEFALAQANLYANIAANRCIGGVVPTPANQCQFNFAYHGAGTGTSPLPIMISYFNNVANNLPNDPTRYAGAFAANYTNASLVAALSRNAPSIGAFNSTNFEATAARRANAVANGRPANFFRVNPTTPNGSWTVENTNKTWYNAAVIEVRRRLSSGLRVNASYVFSKAMANAFTNDAAGGNSQPPTQREGIGFELARNVQVSDLRHQFKVDATYDLPFGRGRQFGSSANGFLNGLIGGWTIAPTLRWQSGSPISIGNVQLVGMTVKELQDSIKIRKEADFVYFLPADIILNSQKAFNISVANTTTNNGYGTTFGTGGPTGRFLAPAGYGNCISRYGGECGFANLVVYGPSFFKIDASLSKQLQFGERLKIELRATALDLLNHPNFRVGGFGGDTTGFGCCGATFGQLPNGSAYQDTSTTNDPGGRVIDLMLRINW
jgi:hypothetical protein